MYAAGVIVVVVVVRRGGGEGVERSIGGGVVDEVCVSHGQS